MLIGRSVSCGLVCGEKCSRLVGLGPKPLESFFIGIQGRPAGRVRLQTNAAVVVGDLAVVEVLGASGTDHELDGTEDLVGHLCLLRSQQVELELGED